MLRLIKSGMTSRSCPETTQAPVRNKTVFMSGTVRKHLKPKSGPIPCPGLTQHRTRSWSNPIRGELPASERTPPNQGIKYYSQQRGRSMGIPATPDRVPGLSPRSELMCGR